MPIGCLGLHTPPHTQTPSYGPATIFEGGPMLFIDIFFCIKANLAIILLRTKLCVNTCRDLPLSHQLDQALTVTGDGWQRGRYLGGIQKPEMSRLCECISVHEIILVGRLTIPLTVTV